MIDALMSLAASIVSLLAETTTNDTTHDGRALHDDQDSPLSSSHNTNASNESTFTSGVFWAVNAVWIVVFLSLICWCWKCGGAERLTAWIQQSRESSDEEFAGRMRRMQQEQQPQPKNPEQRKQELQESFMRNKVKMIVSASDYVQDKADPDTAPAADMENDADEGATFDPDTAPAAADEGQADNQEPAEELDDLSAMEQGLVEHSQLFDEPAAESEESRDNLAVVGRTDLESNSEPSGEPLLDDDAGDIGANHDGLEAEIREMGGDASALEAMEAGLMETEDNEEYTALNDGEFMADDEDEEQTNPLAVMNDYEMDAEAESGFLSIPEQQRTVPNCCAVCLCPYEEGESLIWSSNKLCQHAFHEECIIDWLVKMQDGTPCPCCRQPFTDLPQPQKKKKVISWEPGRSLDPSVIRLR